MEKLSDYIQTTFKIDESKFLEVLKSYPNARQNIHGILGEMLFKDHAESLGYEVLRIKEKPEGGYNAKSEDARGDFYIRKHDTKGNKWFVVECKGVKSNAEKRNSLTKKKSCLNLLLKHSFDRNKHVNSIFHSGKKSYNKSKERWEEVNEGVFPNFTWNKQNPGSGIPDLNGVWTAKNDIKEWIDSFPLSSFTEDAYWDLTEPIRLLQTHMPSTRTDPKTKIKSTGPLVSEFSILCVDLFLKTGKHEFVFANSKKLNPQAESPNHLQQNYTIDILVQKDNFKRHNLLKPWYSDINLCIQETKPKARKLDKTQLDLR